jgi:hypothetical protein
VKNIGHYAFYKCNSLTSITFQGSLTSIGNYAFNNCGSLTNVDTPNGVTSIGIEAFYGCSSLTSINIQKGVTSIGYYAFWDCSSLTSVTLPENMTSIGGGAFYGCSSLTSVTLPENMTSIGGGAFCGCSSLTSVSIPQGVTSIGEDVFRGCSSLTSINIPESVTSIGEKAFYYCSSLTSINIPESVTSIGEDAFGGCISLPNIHIPESVTSIGEDAFWSCSSLTSINIPESVTSIGGGTFRGCSSLTSINIPESVTSIGGGTFYGCSSLTSINIPESVTSIGEKAFYDCKSLKTIKWNTSFSLTDMFNYHNAILFVYSAQDGTIPEGYKDFTYYAIDDIFEILDITSLDTSYAIYPVKVKKVIYTKTFSSYNDIWYTISLPFKPTQITHEEKGAIVPFDSDIDGAKNFWLRELTPDGYQDVTEMEANHAYIIAMPTSDNYADEFRLNGTITFSAEEVEFNCDSWKSVISEGPTYSMYPTYDTVKKSMDVYALNSKYWVDGYNNGFVWVRGAMDVNPFEAYVKLNDGTATMRSVLPMSEGKRTAVRGASSSGDASSRGAYGHQKPQRDDM